MRAGPRFSSRSRDRRRRGGPTFRVPCFSARACAGRSDAGHSAPPSMALLSAALSRDGYRKVTDIMRGDEVLRKGRKRGAGGRAPRWGGGGGRRAGVAVRRGRVLPRLPGDAVGDGAVDVAVWRSSPGDQPDAGGESGEHGAQPSRRSARDATRSKAGPSVRWATRTTKRLR